MEKSPASVADESIVCKRPLDDISTMQDIINSIADAVVNISEQGQILSFNHSATKMFGYNEHEVLAKNFNILLPIALNSDHDGLSHDFFSQDLLNRMKKGQELAAITKDGAQFPVSLTITPVINQEHTIFTALIRDMTSVKLLESDNLRSLKAAEELSSRLDFALAAPHIGVWDYNINHEFMSWDKRMYSLRGIEENESTFSSNSWQKCIHTDDLPFVNEQITHCITTGEEFNMIFRVIWPDNSLHHIEAHAKVIKDEFGQAVRLIGTNREITEQVNLQQLQQQVLDMAEESLRLKSEFLASMSHEIRTPMNGVVGMLGLLEYSELTETQQHHVQLAQSSAQSLLLLINDILDFSKIESGKLDFECIDFNLCSLLSDFSQVLAIKAQEKEVELILDISKIDNVMVLGDPNRLRQILTNLVGNAIKFTEQGEITIRASLLPAEDKKTGNAIFHCSITDTGIGIKSDAIEQLFDSFTQLDASTTRKYGGTGLGLAIVKQLCNLMNGDIKVTSSLGSGSCFEFTLTLQHSEQPLAYIPEIDCAGCTVLVVDNNDTHLEILDGQLTRWGAEVTTANNVFDALQQLEIHPKNYFNIAILDKKVSDLDAEILGTKLKKHHNSQDIKLIMMTSMAERGDGQYFADLGFDAYFPKPTVPKDLYNALCVVLADGETLTSASPLVTKHNLRGMLPHEPADPFPKDSKILIVEDNRINQVVLLGILSNLGLTADVASNGKEALAYLLSAQYDDPYQLLIMDCQMPEMDGYQATKAIRSAEAGQHYIDVPIIAMTANAMKGDEEKCLDSGMNDYLTKPIDLKKLTNRLIRWLKPKTCQSKTSISAVNKLKSNVAINELTHNTTNEQPIIKIKPQQNFPTKVNNGKPTEKKRSVWDLDGFMKRISHNEVIGKKLLALFMEEVPADIELLQQAIERGYSKDIIALAHKTKGSSRNLGADNLAYVCNEIEGLAKQEKLVELTNLQSKLTTDFNQFIVKIKKHILT